jgi:hypothetical protein
VIATQGANLLRERYPKLVDELVAEGKVKREHAAEQLLIIGLVGSIGTFYSFAMITFFLNSLTLLS